MQQPRSSTATKSELLVTGFRLRFTNMKKKIHFELSHDDLEAAIDCDAYQRWFRF